MWRNVFSTISSQLLLQVQSSYVQQARTTFILKRRWPPGLHKKNAAPHKLRGRNFVYELVEDTSIKKQETMDIILTNYVEGLGGRGDIVQVKPNFAYNKLILPKLGVYNTPENYKKYIEASPATMKTIEHSSANAPKTQNALQHLLLAVTMNKTSPWTIEPWHIRASLRKAGYHAPEETIKLPEKPISGPDLSLEGKEFVVTVTINNFEKAYVRCRLHHWSTVPSERLPYEFEFWKNRAEAIFPEEESILNSLPTQAVDEKPPSEIF